MLRLYIKPPNQSKCVGFLLVCESWLWFLKAIVYSRGRGGYKLQSVMCFWHFANSYWQEIPATARSLPIPHFILRGEKVTGEDHLWSTRCQSCLYIIKATTGNEHTERVFFFFSSVTADNFWAPAQILRMSMCLFEIGCSLFRQLP